MHFCSCVCGLVNRKTDVVSGQGTSASNIAASMGRVACSQRGRLGVEGIVVNTPSAPASSAPFRSFSSSCWITRSSSNSLDGTRSDDSPPPRPVPPRPTRQPQSSMSVRPCGRSHVPSAYPHNVQSSVFRRQMRHMLHQVEYKLLVNKHRRTVQSPVLVDAHPAKGDPRGQREVARLPAVELDAQQSIKQGERNKHGSVSGAQVGKEPGGSTSESKKPGRLPAIRTPWLKPEW